MPLRVQLLAGCWQLGGGTRFFYLGLRVEKTWRKCWKSSSVVPITTLHRPSELVSKPQIFCVLFTSNREEVIRRRVLAV